MVTIKFICVIAGAHIMELYNFILSEWLTVLCHSLQPEMSEGPWQAELDCGYQQAGKSSHAMLHSSGSAGTQRATADMVGTGRQ